MSRKQKTHPRVVMVDGGASREESGRARRYAYDIAYVPPSSRPSTTRSEDVNYIMVLNIIIYYIFHVYEKTNSLHDANATEFRFFFSPPPPTAVSPSSSSQVVEPRRSRSAAE